MIVIDVKCTLSQNLFLLQLVAFYRDEHARLVGTESATTSSNTYIAHDFLQFRLLLTSVLFHFYIETTTIQQNFTDRRTSVTVVVVIGFTVLVPI